jgi:predicted nucleic acid-binding protein
MIVVSDTSVVTSLIQIGRIELLFEIFGGVMIPEAVAEELSVSHVLLPPWIQIQGTTDKP